MVRRVAIEQDSSGTVATAVDASTNEGEEANSTFTSAPVTNNEAAVPVSPNPEQAVYVSSNADTPAPEPRIAQITPEPPVAAVTPSYNLTLPIIFVPMAVSAVIFLLLWSVVNGWFERLIF